MSVDAVFVGKAVANRNPNWWKLSFSRSYPFVRRTYSFDSYTEFAVSQVWKGTIQSHAIVDSLSNTSCGLALEPGQEYLIYAYFRGSHLVTHICTRTTALVSASEDLAVLGPGSPPAPSTSSRFGLFSLVVAGMILAILVWLVKVLTAYFINQREGQSG